MSDNIIRAENLSKHYLSKHYVLSHQRSRLGQYKPLRNVMADGGRAFASSFGAARVKWEDASKDAFWALKDGD